MNFSLICLTMESSWVANRDVSTAILPVFIRRWGRLLRVAICSTMKTSSITVETSRSTSQSDSIVRQTNKVHLSQIFFLFFCILVVRSWPVGRVLLCSLIIKMSRLLIAAKNVMSFLHFSCSRCVKILSFIKWEPVWLDHQDTTCTKCIQSLTPPVLLYS